MGQVLIRNLDDNVIEAYRAAAQRNQRSLEAELRHALVEIRPLSPQEVEARIARMREIAAMAPDVPQTPAETLVREGRDR